MGAHAPGAALLAGVDDVGGALVRREERVRRLRRPVRVLELRRACVCVCVC